MSAAPLTDAELAYYDINALLLGFMVVCAFLSMFISNSATAACMLPIARTLIHTIGASTKFGKGLLLGVAYSCSLGGMACLTGTGTNIAFAGFWATTYGDIDGGAVTFGRWLAFGLPLSTILILLVWLVLCSCFIGWPRCAETFNYPHFPRFFSIFSRFPRDFWPCSLDSWRPDAENGRKMGENG